MYSNGIIFGNFNNCPVLQLQEYSSMVTELSTDVTLTADLDGLSIDEIINRALSFCNKLPHNCNTYINQISDLKSRLSRGRLHLAVLGQFNRGKSTFLNALTGLDVLPTSVLPSTSVPTIIAYGKELSCCVRFLDSKPPLFIRQSADAIRDTLTKYVAEENNPNNQLCVKEVEVTTPSPLLENGTVLLDTPGFGSTHLHNTRTALTVLTECDAAIFLLSADPPLTQTELEFLKQVNLYVPRIFFVVNKTDLLSSNELATIDAFITNILVMQMKYPADLKLFHICARKGAQAKGDLQSSAWIESGINEIKTEVLDFMIREKYFTLSEALNDKFKESINAIEQKILEEINDYKDPLSKLKNEYTVITDQNTQLKKVTEKEMALITVEENAVLKYLEDHLKAVKESLSAELTNEFSSVVKKYQISKKTIQSVAATFSNLASEKLRRLYLTTISNCNKPIRKAVQIHLHEFVTIIENVKSLLGEKPSGAAIAIDKIDQCEIDAQQWNPSSALEFQLTSQWNDFFKSSSTLQYDLIRQFNTTIGTYVPSQIESLNQIICRQIHDAFVKVRALLERDYGSLVKILDESLKKKNSAMQERISIHGGRTLELQQKLEQFNSIKKILR
jgi:GTPase Era involved in 16S rRNA processing